MPGRLSPRGSCRQGAGEGRGLFGGGQVGFQLGLVGWLYCSTLVWSCGDLLKRPNIESTELASTQGLFTAAVVKQPKVPVLCDGQLQIGLPGQR